MIKENKNRKIKGTNYFLEIDDENYEIVQKFTDKIIEEYINNFSNVGYTNKSKNEKINELFKRYDFYSKYYVNTVKIEDDITFHKNNVIVYFQEQIKNQSKKQGFYHELGILVTKDDDLPINKILREYNMTLFEYHDKIQYFDDKIDELIQYCEDIEILKPRFIFYNYNRCKEIYSSANTINHNQIKRKITDYFKEFKSVFSVGICQKLYLSYNQLDKK